MADFLPHWDFTTVICHDKYSLQYVRSCLQRWTEVAWVEALNQSFFFFFFCLQPEINDQEVEWGEFLYRILTGQELCLSVITQSYRFASRGSLPWTFKNKLCFTEKKSRCTAIVTCGGKGDSLFSGASVTPLYIVHRGQRRRRLRKKPWYQRERECSGGGK